MPNLLPCLNPACSHAFTAEQLKGVTMLRCPACGMEFRFGESTATQAARPAVSRKATPALPPVPITKPVSASPRVQPAPPRAAPPRTTPPPVARPPAPAARARGAGLPPPIPATTAVTAAESEILPDTVLPEDGVVAPVAPLVAPLVAPPVAAPVAPASPASGFADAMANTGPLIRPRYRPGGWGWPAYLGLGGGVLLAVAAVFLVVILSRRRGVDPDDGKGTEKKPPPARVIEGYVRSGTKEEKVVRLTIGDKPWEHETNLRKGFDAVVALQRKDAKAWLGIVVKDYGGTRPRDAELIAAAKERLEDVFDNSLELGDEVQKVELAGEPAQRIVFKGKLESAVCRGECYMLSQRGLGYWLYLIAPTADAVRKELAELQEANVIAFVDERLAWREQPVKLESFAANKLPVALQAPEGVWEKFPPFEEDDCTDLYLAGKYKQEKDNRKNASAAVLALDKEADTKSALAAARDFVEKKRKEENKDAVLALAGGGDIPEQGELGTTAKFANRQGRIVELRVQDKERPLRYLMLAVIVEPERTIAVVCECSWESRLIWREDFRELLATLRVKSE
jgi:hypothetical protein